ncbi:Flagellar L-ring protein FlgH [hydrothermal vent metagenome]|uniref:Flagellar L-ring protein FlgH n=1 Tax=hydrothermal vent metagenome TaxID=652676 RepID=A0A3B0TY04_9ZZZZ
MNIFKLITITVLFGALGACTASERLSQIGKTPQLSAINNPTAQSGYRPVVMPMPKPEVASYQANSLFRTNARGFFKDQRARRVGDILTVKVVIADKAQIANQTTRGRTSTNTGGIGGVLGSIFNSVVPGLAGSTSIDVSSGVKDAGSGSVNRAETLQTDVAAVITQVLPNGNLVIEGRQEVRVNFEIRDLIIAGIVRPEDIESDNTIKSSKIAEARIAYGGRGQITDVQQPRYGQQVLDAILPF